MFVIVCPSVKYRVQSHNQLMLSIATKSFDFIFDFAQHSFCPIFRGLCQQGISKFPYIETKKIETILYVCNLSFLF